VITDHTALKSALQINTIERRSARLNEWAMFLSTFLPKMTIVHRSEKAHQNANDLSRLASRPIEERLSLPTIIIEDKNGFFDHLANALPENGTFRKIHKHLSDQVERTKNDEDEANTTYQFYRLNSDTGLLYLVSQPDPNRLCIPKALEKEVLEYAHDKHAHGEVHRTYDLLRRSVFMPKMKKLVHDYVTSCPFCQLSKTSRQLPYGELHSIDLPPEPLSKVSIDFIVALSLTQEGYNALMIVTDRFFKFILLVSGNEKLSASEWASLYWKFVYKLWGIPGKIISDRDLKFNSDFWRTVFQKCGVSLGMTTAYHPFADGQAERTNQTVETAIRCLLIGEYEENWSLMLSKVEYSLNIFENSSIKITSFEVLYGVKPRDPLMALISKTNFENKEGIQFLKARQEIRNDVIDAVKLAQTKMAVLYDNKHRPAELKGKAYIKMSKVGTPGYHLPKSSSLSTKKVGPFNIIRKVGDLAYELELSSSMKIHSVIFIAHLEQALEDKFDRLIKDVPSLIVVEEQKQ
jgi:hypothetical protein